MGASDFYAEAVGETARKAFHTAVENALDYHGRGGYTGSIAEKDNFVMLIVPSSQDHSRKQWCRVVQDAETFYGETPQQAKARMQKAFPDLTAHDTTQAMRDNSKISDKWGPAGCVALGKNRYAFFGWASC